MKFWPETQRGPTKEDRFSQLTASNDVHKSAAIASFQTINENKSRFPKSFWCEGSEN